MTQILGPDTVLIAVPLAIARDVADFIVERSVGVERTVGHAAEETSAVVPGQGVWTERQVGLLADQVRYPGVLALLDRCASEAGTWIVKAEVEEAQGISPIQLRNELGALSKLSKRTFGRVTWPMEWRKERGIFSYRMDSQVAMWWLAAREGAK